MNDPRRTAQLLQNIYGENVGNRVFERLCGLLETYSGRLPHPHQSELTQKDIVLIAYPDQVREPALPPLSTLSQFCSRHLAGLVNGVHILPFYPSSSDDGFSVIDYRDVDPQFGSWDDIARIGRNFRLMFDGVFNHVSAQNTWFRAFLNDDPLYRDFFIAVDGNPDLSQVVRPRSLPLLTRFHTAGGDRRVWTTFSTDQVDLNYSNPEVLLEILDTLLFYVARGATLIRLDAIAYLWKEIGTSCIHLPQTHRVIQVFRSVLDQVAPQVKLVTETNVAHHDNISYFGDGTNEAQLVYNFALPPLVLHSFLSGSAWELSHWTASLPLHLSQQVTFFNFLASHDGIGINPARGILSASEIAALVEHTLSTGGLVSYASAHDGSEFPYELNISYFDALSGSGRQDLPSPDIDVDRFIAAQAIMLCLAGVPGIYFHSLFGSRGWREGVFRTGLRRAINRQKLDRAALEAALADPTSLRCRVFSRYRQLLRARAASPAFHPQGVQQALDLGEAVFAVLRTDLDSSRRVLCLHNVSARPQQLHLPDGFAPATDLITGERVTGRRLTFAPFQGLWLEHEES